MIVSLLTSIHLFEFLIMRHKPNCLYWAKHLRSKRKSVQGYFWTCGDKISTHADFSPKIFMNEDIPRSINNINHSFNQTRFRSEKVGQCAKTIKLLRKPITQNRKHLLPWSLRMRELFSTRGHNSNDLPNCQKMTFSLLARKLYEMSPHSGIKRHSA